MTVNMKRWRQSASLILVAKANFIQNACNNQYNYKLLTIQRSTNTGFMPGMYVFPGGNTEKADASESWLQLFYNFGFKWETFASLYEHNAYRPPIFCNNAINEIPKYLSLRISAIRETFEESGVLICRSNKIKYEGSVTQWASFIGGPEVTKWQDKIHDDPWQFIELCKTLDIYPDVWALSEWSNWVTPPSLRLHFDTAFFLATFNQMPPTFAEKKEVQNLKWATPTEYLELFKMEEILLPPPQFYEISRLGNFLDISELSKFSAGRSTFGLERYLPHRVCTDKGTYTILPGDDLYPEEVNPSDVSVPYVRNLPESKIQNRILHRNEFNLHLIILNFKPKYNHIAPKL